MWSTSSGDDGRKMPNGHGSSSMEEADKGGNCKMCKGHRSLSVEEAYKGGEISLKKGLWTEAEDAILLEYVKKHGARNWNAVQKNSGLARCGSSCRFRWVNYLRPNLKKGAFTAEEEQLIVELHASMGNKWALMAAMLPGRTDNEIKHFWKARVKRMQRACQTTYPEEVDIYPQQLSNGNQENFDIHASLVNVVAQEDLRRDTIIVVDDPVSPKGAHTPSSQNQPTSVDGWVGHNRKRRSEGGEKLQSKKGKKSHRDNVPDALVTKFNSTDFETLERNPFVCLPKIYELGTSLLEGEAERKKQEEEYIVLKKGWDDALEEMNTLKGSVSALEEKNKELAKLVEASSREVDDLRKEVASLRAARDNAIGYATHVSTEKENVYKKLTELVAALKS